MPATAHAPSLGAREPDRVPATGQSGPDPGKPGPGPRKLYRIPEAMRLLSLSRSAVYKLIGAGRLDSVKEGAARLIPAEAINEYVALLKAEAEEGR